MLLIKNPTFNQADIEGWLKEFDEALEEDFSLQFQQVWHESKRER